MPDRIRGVWARFWDLVDGDSVRPFIWLYYVPLLAFGAVVLVALSLNAAAIQPVALAILWIWVQVPATFAAMAGLALRHGGAPLHEMTTLLLFRDWIGLVMQLAGHLCMSVVLLAFELVAGGVVALGPAGITEGAIGVLIWWIILFAMFAISSYIVGCVLLSLQVARKIQRGRQLRRASRP